MMILSLVVILSLMNLRVLLIAVTLLAGGAVGWMFDPICGLAVVVVGVSAVMFVRRGAPPAKQEVLPEYLHSALNGLTEGILVLDYNGTIIFANDTFMEMTGESRSGLIDRKAKEIDWKWIDIDAPGDQSPPLHWLNAIKEGRDRCGRFVGIPGQQDLTLILRAVPILEDGQQPRGAICSLQDVTRIHRKEAEAESLMKAIRQSSLQIRQQNAELEELVIRDPLTGCLNRRAGYDAIERLWMEARECHEDFSCALVDIDGFRAINEEFGHLIADKVLSAVGECLKAGARRNDVVCRYAGEEFLILMPRTTLDDAAFLSERLRQSISRMQQTDVDVTVSIGVAAWSSDQASPQDILSIAEEHVATAKQRGRNLVVKKVEASQRSSQITQVIGEPVSRSTVIPFPAVTALISALAYRDLATASHSRRVADLSVAVGLRLMSLRSCYILETAALLHDIGKIGVPDFLLHKQTPLTEAERSEIQTHSSMGLEIVRTAFGSPELSAILENAGILYEESLERQLSLPLGARILAIADAYDSMVNEQIYRKASTVEEAIAELKRCAGTQFDPEIVSVFIDVMRMRSRELTPGVKVDREMALALGLQLERLAEAVDQQDLELLRVLAGQLVQTANHIDTSEIIEKARELERAVGVGGDQLGILQKASELLACCRATQSSYLEVLPMHLVSQP